MPRTSRPQSYYDDIKTKFKEERDKRLTYRPPGTTQYTSELTGELEKYSTDPWRKKPIANQSTIKLRSYLSVGLFRATHLWPPT